MIKENISDHIALVSMSYADYLEIKNNIEAKLIKLSDSKLYPFLKKNKEWVDLKKEMDTLKVKRQDLESKIYFSEVLTRK